MANHSLETVDEELGFLSPFLNPYIMDDVIGVGGNPNKLFLKNTWNILPVPDYQTSLFSIRQTSRSVFLFAEVYWKFFREEQRNYLFPGPKLLWFENSWTWYPL